MTLINTVGTTTMVRLQRLLIMPTLLLSTCHCAVLLHVVVPRHPSPILHRHFRLVPLPEKARLSLQLLGLVLPWETCLDHPPLVFTRRWTHPSLPPTLSLLLFLRLAAAFG